MKQKLTKLTVGGIVLLIIFSVSIVYAQPQKLGGPFYYSDGFEGKNPASNYTFELTTEGPVTANNVDFNDTVNPHEGQHHITIHVISGGAGGANNPNFRLRTNHGIIPNTSNSFAIRWFTYYNQSTASFADISYETRITDNAGNNIRITNSTGNLGNEGLTVTGLSVSDSTIVNESAWFVERNNRSTYAQRTLKAHENLSFFLYQDDILVAKGNLTDMNFDSNPLFQFHIDWEENSNLREVNVYFDNILSLENSTDFDTFSVSGFVKDDAGNVLDNVTVTANTSSNTVESNENGFYSIELANGTHELTGSKDGFQDGTRIITIEGTSLINQNITLTTVALELRHNPYMPHDTRQPIRVFFTNETENEVTNSAAVISNNTSIVIVNNSTNEFVSTSDVRVNDRVTITVRFENQEITETITVANRSIENIEIMPPELWISAFIGFDDSVGGFGLGTTIEYIFLLILTITVITDKTKDRNIGLGIGFGGLFLLWALDYIDLFFVSIGFLAIVLFLLIQKRQLPNG